MKTVRSNSLVFYLLVCGAVVGVVVGVRSSCTQGTAEIGLLNPARPTVNGLERPTVNESAGPVVLCANVTCWNSPNNDQINVSVVYQNRNAVGGSDFEEIPYSFLFTPNLTSYCFDIVIMNDNVYELRQEFFVNITTENQNVLLDPHYTAIAINDDDEVTIGWENQTYTARETDEHLEVCVRLKGVLENVFLQSNMVLEEGSAISGEDFVFHDTVFTFPRRSNSSSRVCFLATIIKDITYEGEKNFSIMISNNPERSKVEPARTTVVIQDHNVITDQQPTSACEGLRNLVNFSSAVDICDLQNSADSLVCDTVTCSTSNWNLILSLNACEGEVMLNVTDNTGNATTNGVFPSKQQEQEFVYILKNKNETINLSSRVVSSEQMLYYLLFLDSSTLNISFPITAIPVECNRYDATTPNATATATASTTAHTVTLNNIEYTSNSKEKETALAVYASIASVLVFLLEWLE